jgi:hypothetical protein
VDDVLDNTLNVAVLLRKVELPQSSGRLVVVGVRLEDPAGLPLSSDNALRNVNTTFRGLTSGRNAQGAVVVEKRCGRPVGRGEPTYTHLAVFVSRKGLRVLMDEARTAMSEI